MSKLESPTHVFVSDGELFISTDEHVVRKVLRNGQIVTIAGTGDIGYSGDGQPATEANLNRPSSVAVSSSNQVYISDGSNNVILRIDRSGIITTIAGTGVENYNGDDKLAIHAQLNFPCGLFVTEDEEVLFCDLGNNRVRKIDRYGIISTIAGTDNTASNDDDQLATSAKLLDPDTVCVVNDEIYFSESGRIRKILANGMIKTIAGTGESGYSGDGMLAIHARLNCPLGIFVDEQSQVYIADSINNRVRKIDQNGIISTIVGTGEKGNSGDIPFDFKKYPHIGPRKKQHPFKPFSNQYRDVRFSFQEM